MVSSMEESKSLPEKDNEKQGNHINPSSIKTNCVVKQKQMLVHLRNQFYSLKKIKRKGKKGNLINPNSIKKNYVVKQKQLLVHLRNQFD